MSRMIKSFTESRNNSTPVASRSRSLIHTPDSVPGINDVSEMDDPLELELTLSSAGSDTDEDADAEILIPKIDFFSLEEAFVNAQEVASCKTEKILFCSKENGEEYVQAMDEDKTEEKRSYEANIKRLRERLEQLKAEDIQTAAELQALEKELEEVKTKKTTSWKKAKADFAKTTTKLAKVEKKLEQRQTTSNCQRRFIEKTGVVFGFSGDGMYKSIGFNNIAEDEICCLYFSVLSLPSFKVERAVPNFKEFEQLAEDVNKSLDILRLLFEARQYFDRDAKQKAKELKEFSSPPLPAAQHTLQLRK